VQANVDAVLNYGLQSGLKQFTVEPSKVEQQSVDSKKSVQHNQYDSAGFRHFI